MILYFDDIVFEFLSNERNLEQKLDRYPTNLARGYNPNKLRKKMKNKMKSVDNKKKLELNKTVKNLRGIKLCPRKLLWRKRLMEV